MRETAKYKKKNVHISGPENVRENSLSMRIESFISRIKGQCMFFGN